MPIEDIEKQILEDLKISTDYPPEKVAELRKAIEESVVKNLLSVDELSIISIKDIEPFPSLMNFITRKSKEDLSEAHTLIKSHEREISLLRSELHMSTHCIKKKLLKRKGVIRYLEKKIIELEKEVENY